MTSVNSAIRGHTPVFGIPGASAWDRVGTEFAHQASASSFRRRFPRLGALLLGKSRFAGLTAPEAIAAFRAKPDPKLLPEAARSWGYGALGEELVGAALNTLDGRFQVAHDLKILRKGSEVANIDHLVTGPGGVVLVDAKYWAGRVVTNGDNTGLLRQGLDRAPGPDEALQRSMKSLEFEVASVGPTSVGAIVIAIAGRGTVGSGSGPGSKAAVLRLPATQTRPDLYVTHARNVAALVLSLNSGGISQGLKTLRIKDVVLASRGQLGLPVRGKRR